ncbi:MAG: OadG family protein [Pseudomonadales bacterium]|nr:OadG family protein [Pseudomonadales bacterium]NRA16851.1 OadG family protein [Oceanospirillaceae bacterium]
MEESLISQGLSLMVFGMGFVFVFLTLLVGVTMLMSKLVVKFAPVAVAPLKKVRRNAAPVAAATDDELVAVITAAVHQYRS